MWCNSSTGWEIRRPLNGCRLGWRQRQKREAPREAGLSDGIVATPLGAASRALWSGFLRHPREHYATRHGIRAASGFPSRHMLRGRKKLSGLFAAGAGAGRDIAGRRGVLVRHDATRIDHRQGRARGCGRIRSRQPDARKEPTRDYPAIVAQLQVLFQYIEVCILRASPRFSHGPARGVCDQLVPTAQRQRAVAERSRIRSRSEPKLPQPA